MQASKLALVLGCAAMLTSCGGDDNPAPTPTTAPIAVSPTPTPASGTDQCSLSARQDFVLDRVQEWYLFPELVDTSVNKAAYASVEEYLDALLAPARAQSRDRYFSYLTSIAEENAYYETGETADFGFRLTYDPVTQQLFVLESFEGSSALGANVDRGTEITAIGLPGSSPTSVATLLSQGGVDALVAALGPDAAGTTRVFRVIDAGGVERDVTLAKTSFALDPVSDRYGTRIIDDNGRRVGYLNLRNFIEPAEDDLIAAFGEFQQQGITDLVIDLRYNGGGLFSVAALLGDLLGRNREGQTFGTLTFRPSKADQNSPRTFEPLSQSIQPTRIAFIGTDSTASASELVINGMQPYLGQNMALIGRNTFGKPVGQEAFDLSSCDDRLRLVTFKIENANGLGDYYNGLAATVPNTCAAVDDLEYALGDPREDMLAKALGFLAGRSCTPISAASARIASVNRPVGTRAERRRMLQSERPGTIERESPGLF